MGVRRRVAITIGSISWMPRFLPQIVFCDNKIHSISGQRLSLLDIAGLPNITLKVAGRKSGVLRVTRLLAVPQEEDWLVAGSYFGSPKLPQWVLNMRAADTVRIMRGGQEWAAVPTELTGADRDAAWQRLREVWPNFDLYEHRTSRRIPVFRLSPFQEF
ncbi:nitroreductase family deazaflavin-dependent oxidoreductase [Gordonia sp. ABSL1-1]|uniref:nitroreductase family deazaflavin-dependent oxidoreductase n=1 Tax=Gordonia sp. ABSL1-1 TaxID=3053923 RepID=UPI002573640B|nr:nitroreductase family deazaflavin-dependent oxidoreductase [Gordonia sp. ABSL1-1]MDL9938801.1 nitroreductase family deazaflavin-dependent oxidoreductase [Gordonia sp. ABSL1-1]